MRCYGDSELCLSLLCGNHYFGYGILVSCGNSSYTLTIASVEPWYTTNKNVLFASSDESVATVDENGKITGISEGNAIITVSAADGGGAQALCNVQVTSGYSEFTIEGTILKAYSGNAAVVVVPEEVTDIGTFS